MTLPFTQYEFEREIYRCLDRGDEQRLAELTGKSAGFISQLYNPEDERESNLFKAAREIAKLIEISPERGACVLRVFVSFVERAIREKACRCAKSEGVKFNGELREFMDTVFAGASADVRIKELDDVIWQAIELKKAYRDELRASLNLDGNTNGGGGGARRTDG